jgi:hypothetical protein
MPKLKMSGVIPPPRLYAFVVSTGITLLLMGVKLGIFCEGRLAQLEEVFGGGGMDNIA